MSTERFFAVVTTIREPSPAIRRMKDVLERAGCRLIVIGDRDGPSSFPLEGISPILYLEQERLPFRLARLLPFGHYARKNLGYLVALREEASCIYETDDDNSPLASWRPRPKAVPVRKATGTPWVNVYRFYSDERIWPRGFPLRFVREYDSPRSEDAGELLVVEAPVQQGLADVSPDLDAVCRLLQDRTVRFRPGNSVLLPRGSWCPFNSQSTWWHAPAWPLLYLPSHCSFRMADIWRSFVAQRCLWELGLGMVFHSAEVEHERNAHDPMEDFRQEIPGYVGNERLVRVLEGTTLNPETDSIGENLVRCYERLADEGFFPREELSLVAAWGEDIKDLAT